MKLIKLLPFLMVFSCGSEEDSTEFVAPVEVVDYLDDNESTSKAYLTLDELPECNEDRKSNLAYIESEKVFYNCNDEWKKIVVADQSNEVKSLEMVNCHTTHPLVSPYFGANYTYQRFSNGTAFIFAYISKYVSGDRKEIFSSSALWGAGTQGAIKGGVISLDSDFIYNELYMNPEHTILYHKMKSSPDSEVILEFSITTDADGNNTCTLVE